MSVKEKRKILCLLEDYANELLFVLNHKYFLKSYSKKPNFLVCILYLFSCFFSHYFCEGGGRGGEENEDREKKTKELEIDMNK